MAVSTAVSQVCHRLGVCREDVALHPHQPLTSTLSLVLLCVSNRVSRILARTQSILINCFFLTIDFTNTVTTAVGVYTNWFEVNFEENYYILYHSLSIHLFLRYDLHWCMCVYLFFWPFNKYSVEIQSMATRPYWTYVETINISAFIWLPKSLFVF